MTLKELQQEIQNTAGFYAMKEKKEDGGSDPEWHQVFQIPVAFRNESNELNITTIKVYQLRNSSGELIDDYAYFPGNSPADVASK